jgi:uncharacterized membrane protein YeiH
VGLLDGLALGLFAVTGTACALEHNLPAVSAILVGSVSAVGGGVAVSVLQGKVARILRTRATPKNTRAGSRHPGTQSASE